MPVCPSLSKSNVWNIIKGVKLIFNPELLINNSRNSNFAPRMLADRVTHPQLLIEAFF